MPTGCCKEGCRWEKELNVFFPLSSGVVLVSENTVAVESVLSFLSRHPEQLSSGLLGGAATPDRIRRPSLPSTSVGRYTMFMDGMIWGY